MKRHIDHFLHSAIDWLFRRRSPALLTMRIGLICLISAIGGWSLALSMPWDENQLKFDLASAEGTPVLLSYLAACLGTVLLVVGLIWEVGRYRADQQRLSRKKVIVVEARGLRDTAGTPLTEAVPNSLEGLREQLLVDMRQRIRDGVIIDPEEAVRRLNSLPADIHRRIDGIDRRDITYVYGGLAPVPLSFLSGLLLDDEGSLIIMDWDRHSGSWRELDEEDDGKRFTFHGLNEVPNQTTSVTIAVSVSYRVDLAAVRQTIGDVPLVEMVLEEGAPDCHWAEEKQQALGRQFLETAIKLGNHGCKCIHLFLAAQNSVVFRFGRLYDKRNLPEVVVYQYERGACVPYPWAIQMPVGGIQNAIVVRHG